MKNIIIGCLLIFSAYTYALSENIKWKLVYHETFDALIIEPCEWTEDTYGDTSQWQVDIFDEDGAFFRSQFGNEFDTELHKFRSFRKSFTYGDDHWLTFELYGRDENKDGTPESGSTFINFEGKAKLISRRHTDGGIIRTTNELPEIYKIEVTVSRVDFGGDKDNDGNWTENGKFNGYNGDEIASPWRKNWNKTEWLESWHENGLYYACIVDYKNPAPHNNVFMHHHRKVVMDTDNNNYDGGAWSSIYNPNSHQFEEDGSLYANLVWLNGENFGTDFTGNHFSSWTPAGWQTEEWNTNFADKYLPNAEYTFTIERTPDYYTVSISGNFFYGGDTTYIGKKNFREFPVVWHYNRNDEYDGSKNEVKEYNGHAFDTWPEDSYYPDYFFCGDSHINFYEGSAEFDNIKLWVGEVMTGVAAFNAANKPECHLTNFPNPFNPKTSINYQVPEAGNVILSVYNMSGQELAVLIDEEKQAGNYKVVWDGSAYSSGVYLIRMQADNYLSTKKMSLIK